MAGVLKAALVIPSQMWQSYVRALKERPLRTNMITSAVITVTGDFMAQKIEQSRRKKLMQELEQQQQQIEHVRASQRMSPFANSATSLNSDRTMEYPVVGALDLKRSTTMLFWGLCFNGAPATLYFRWLDRTFGTTQNFKTIASKITFNQLTWAPGINLVFFGYVNLIEYALRRGDDFGIRRWLREWRSKTERDFVPTMINSMKVWVLAHGINFAIIPPHLRVVYMNIVSVGWLCYLSMVGYKDIDGNAVTKQLLEQQQQQQQQHQQQQRRHVLGDGLDAPQAAQTSSTSPSQSPTR